MMQAHSLLLARHYTERPDLAHDGKVVVIRTNLRWCSDGFEFTCWNGDVVRGAFIIDAHDREVIAWCAVANAGISGSEVRDMMLEAVERRFGGHRAPHTLLPLDDCLYALQPSIPGLTRSSLHRCLQGHGISRLPDLEGDKPARKKFKSYPIGFFHMERAVVCHWSEDNGERRGAHGGRQALPVRSH